MKLAILADFIGTSPKKKRESNQNRETLSLARSTAMREDKATRGDLIESCTREVGCLVDYTDEWPALSMDLLCLSFSSSSS